MAVTRNGTSVSGAARQEDEVLVPQRGEELLHLTQVSAGGACAQHARTHTRPGGAHTSLLDLLPNGQGQVRSRRALGPPVLERFERTGLLQELIQARTQLLDPVSHGDSRNALERANRMDLVVRAHLSTLNIPGHDEQRLLVQQRGQDRARPRVGDHMGAALDQILVLLRQKVGHHLEMGTAELALPHLRHDFALGVVSRPAIQGLHQAIERELRSNRQEDHRMLPAYFAPLSPSRCSHWVRTKSAWLAARRPAMEMESTLARLSTQIVRAPNQRPKRSAK